MRRFAKSRVHTKACVRLVLGPLAATAILAGWASAQSDNAALSPSRVGQGCLLRLVTRFTSLVAVEEVVANVGGESRTVAAPTELPAGMQLDRVFGAPATGTADAFLEMLGVTLLLMGILMAILLHVLGRRMARKAEAAL